jgi:hypothetical protein
MKKIIIALSMIVTVTFNVNAQQKKAVPSKETKKTEVAAVQNVDIAGQKAEKEAYELAQFLDLNDTQRADFSRLLKMKHERLQNPQLKGTEKAELLNVIEMKIRASLDSGQIEKLEKNAGLWKKLIN